MSERHERSKLIEVFSTRNIDIVSDRSKYLCTDLGYCEEDFVEIVTELISINDTIEKYLTKRKIKRPFPFNIIFKRDLIEYKDFSLDEILSFVDRAQID